jgi:hypothetical protein
MGSLLNASTAGRSTRPACRVQVQVGLRQFEMQDDSNEFRRYAEACLRLADKVQSVEDKAELLSMAQAWVQLADQMGEDGPTRAS